MIFKKIRTSKVEEKKRIKNLEVELLNLQTNFLKLSKVILAHEKDLDFISKNLKQFDTELEQIENIITAPGPQVQEEMNKEISKATNSFALPSINKKLEKKLN